MLIHLEGLACLVTIIIAVLFFGLACAAYAKHFELEAKIGQLKLENRALLKENFHLKVTEWKKGEEVTDNNPSNVESPRQRALALSPLDKGR